jgi:HlyD family secretion protein
MRSPTAAEVLEAELESLVPAPPLRRLAIAALLLVTLGLGGLLTWAALTPLESAVVASGSLVAEGRRKSITLLEPGLLRELLVREGSRVAVGQPLLRLDTTQAEAAAGQARAQYWGQTVRATRLSAELADRRDLVFPPEAHAAAATDGAVRALMEAERRLFEARWAAFEGQLGVQRTRVAQLQEQTQSIIAQRTSTTTRLRTIREELSGTTRLVSQGYATRTRLWELQRSEAELLGNERALQSQEAQTREQIAQAEAEMASISLNRRQDVARELQDALAVVADADQRLKAAADVLARREVLAPEAGIVTDIRFFTPGSSIGAGQAILDIVPADDRLVADTRILPQDVENVRVGQPSRLRLAAFRTADLPMVEARVTSLSADQRTDERGGAYFAARIEMVPGALDAYPGITLAPGMPVEAYVIGEKRSALDYLLRPLRDSLRRAARD